VILAIDPGLATCGWAVVVPSTGEILELGAIITPPIQGLDEWTDRMRRLDGQAEVLQSVARRHACTLIAAEEASLGGPPRARLAMAIALCSSWGHIVGLSRALKSSLLAVPPKVWQHAIQPDCRKIDYEKMFRAMSEHIAMSPIPAGQLRAITARDRNHALDACGIGILAAMKPYEAKTIIRRETR
jgi:hypothetical protein